MKMFPVWTMMHCFFLSFFILYFLVYGALLNSNVVDQNEMATALDAIRKMVTNNSGETHSHEQQSTTVISSAGILSSTRYRFFGLVLFSL